MKEQRTRKKMKRERGRRRNRTRWERRTGRRKSNPPYKLPVGEEQATFPLEAFQTQKASGGRRQRFSQRLLSVCFPPNVGGRWSVSRVSCSSCLSPGRWKQKTSPEWADQGTHAPAAQRGAGPSSTSEGRKAPWLGSHVCASANKAKQTEMMCSEGNCLRKTQRELWSKNKDR